MPTSEQEWLDSNLSTRVTNVASKHSPSYPVRPYAGWRLDPI
jgi:hypothetical protein